MKVPGWLLLIFISYLTERSMFMRYNGSTSSGSSPQGAFLGILLFIIIFNGALLRPPIPRSDYLCIKYIDDLSSLTSINLKSSLLPDPIARPEPLNYNERKKQILPLYNNKLQGMLDELKQFASQNFLRIKEKKTNVIKFNFSRNYDFPPELNIEGFEEKLQVIKKTKLLGLMLTEDLKWASNTDYVVRNGFKRMWKLRRMKVLEVEPLFLLDVYTKEIRSVLELAAPAWHSGLTIKQAADIERVQRVALNIILGDLNQGDRNFCYDMALVILNIEPLSVRREKLCLTFARKTLKSRHCDMFKSTVHNTRNKPSFYEYKSNRTRCHKSPAGGLQYDHLKI